MDFTQKWRKVYNEKWRNFNYSMREPQGENGKWITGCEEHIALSRYAASEGMVMLENDGLLPLKKGTRVALFGTGIIDYIKGGSGSGEVYSAYIRNIFDGFKMKEPYITAYEPIAQYYCDKLKEKYEIISTDIMEEVELPKEYIEKAASCNDVAVITIHRSSGEGYDRKSEKGDFYLTDLEQQLVDNVTAEFPKTVVVLNVGGMIDVEWIKSNPKINAALLSWQAGMEGGVVIADIICGDVNPSGKLTDTFAKTFDDYPSSQTFNESVDYVKYYEDIYVGYRYFCTIPDANKKVNYPFGYGLSYTTFSISKPVATLKGENIEVTSTVENTGNIAGKEVYQVYYSAPQGKLGKPSIELAAFKKTKLLQPGEKETITVSFKINDMSSYDDLGKIQKSAYVLEAGQYEFFAGNSSVNLQAADYKYTIENDIVTEQLTQCCAPNKLEKRMLSDGSFEELPSFPIIEHKGVTYNNTAEKPDHDYRLSEVADGKCSLDEFLLELNDDELIQLMGGIPNKGLANTWGMGGIDRLGIPSIMTADGPAGVRIRPETGIATTAWPCATLISCTWDPDIMYEIGKAGGLEAKENAIAIWLTPAMNIHRNPLCGRNFEYFSEDPLISGKFAAAKVNGMQSVGVGASVKHFACNNKEENRVYSDSRVSERALREIYLRGFEICVKESHPYTLMTSYNLINDRRCCESYEQLQTILREEWGFDGMITTDWAVPCYQVNCIKAGNDIRMNSGKLEEIKSGLAHRVCSKEQLMLAVKHILEMMLKLD